MILALIAGLALFQQAASGNGHVTDSLVAAAEQAIAAGRPWRASRTIAPLLESPTTRTPAVLLLAARAAAGWEGWESVTRLLSGQDWLDSTADGEGRALLARAMVERGDPNAVDHARLAVASTTSDRRKGERFLVLARAHRPGRPSRQRLRSLSRGRCAPRSHCRLAPPSRRRSARRQRRARRAVRAGEGSRRARSHPLDRRARQRAHRVSPPRHQALRAARLQHHRAPAPRAHREERRREGAGAARHDRAPAEALGGADPARAQRARWRARAALPRGRAGRFPSRRGGEPARAGRARLHPGHPIGNAGRRGPHHLRLGPGPARSPSRRNRPVRSGSERPPPRGGALPSRPQSLPHPG